MLQPLAGDGLKRPGLRIDARRISASAAIFLITVCIYFFLSWSALRLLSAEDGVAIFWPASGFAAGLAAILTRPAQLPIAAGVAVSTILANLMERSSVAAIMTFAAGNAVECLLFVRLYRLFDRSKAQLESFGSVVAFLMAAIAAAGLAAVPAALGINLFGLSAASIPNIWFKWLQVDALGIVAVAPMLILLPSTLRTRFNFPVVAEGCAGLVVAIVATQFMFGLDPSQTLHVTPPMVLLPIIIWLAARAPTIFSAIGLLALSLVAVWTALSGGGRFGDLSVPLEDRLFGAKLVALTIALGMLTMAALFARERNVAAALSSSEQRLKLALDAGGMYAFDYDLSNGVVYRSGKLVERFGLPPVGSIEAYLQAMHPDDRGKLESNRASLSPSNRSFTTQYRLKAVDGEMLMVEHSAQAAFDRQGRLTRIVGTCVDVTGQVAARHALEDRERQLREALEAGRVFAFEFDTNTKRVKRSDNAAGILGVPLEHVRDGRQILKDMVDPADRDILDQFRRGAHPDEPFQRVIVRFARPDGRSLWLEIVATSVFGSDGQLIFNRGLMRDVTETHLAELGRAQVIDELDHRVKNALNCMLSVITLSREGQTDLDAFIKGLERRIMSMAKTQERLSSSKWSGVNVETLVLDELAPFRTGLNCTVAGPDIVLEPRPAQAFSFTVHELATNASKYGALSRPGGHVDVAWTIVEVERGSPILELTWRETCAHEIVSPRHESYGITTIRGILPWEVAGSTVDLAFDGNGVSCVIRLPLIPRVDPRTSTKSGEPPVNLAADLVAGR